MLKKTNAAVKQCTVFFIVFSSFFREKSMENPAKSVNTVFVHKNRQKFTYGTIFFRQKMVFDGFLGSPWVARGLPGRPGNVPKSLMFLIHDELRLKTKVDGLREASGRPRRSPQAPSGYDFASIFGSILHVKNKRKHTKSIENNSKNLDELVTLIRATVNS